MSIPFKPADPTVEGFIARLSGWRAEAVKVIRAIILEAAPGVTESVEHRLPHYHLDGPLCFIKTFESHLNLVFHRGTELDDPSGVLSHYGQGDMRHVKVQNLDELDEAAIAGLVRAAVDLNRSEAG